jgi:hypothetical protein
VPIGCLTDPDCGDRLLRRFNIAAGRQPLTGSTQEAVDPRDPLSCILDPDCASSLDRSNELQSLFKRPVTSDDVLHDGVEVGDYISLPADSLLQKPPPAQLRELLTDHESLDDPAGTCVKTAAALAKLSDQAKMLGGMHELEAQQATLRDVVMAYQAAASSCIKAEE